MGDPPAPARGFVAEFEASWPTVDDTRRDSRRLPGRGAAQSYFVDRDGILRSIQVGELTQVEFDRQYALISGPAANDMRGPVGPARVVTPAPTASPGP